MAAARATDRDCHARFAFVAVERNEKIDEVEQTLQERERDRQRFHERDDARIEAREVAQLRYVMRVGEEAYVEEQIRLARHAMLETESDDVHGKAFVRDVGAVRGKDARFERRERDVGRVPDDARPFSQRLERQPLARDGADETPVRLAWVTAARFAITTHERIVASIQEQ